MRAVFDTSVIVAAFRSQYGASNALLAEIYSGRIIPLISLPLFFEYEDVLSRDEHGLSSQQTEAVLKSFALVAAPVDIHFKWRPQLPDPADEMVLEVAINGMADVIVTHNVRDFLSVKGQFQLKVMRPSELLKRIRS